MNKDRDMFYNTYGYAGGNPAMMNPMQGMMPGQMNPFVNTNELNIKNTCRVSLYLYNTKEEVDVLIEALKRSEDIFKVVI